MYQVSFSDQSMTELEKLDTHKQLELADMISSLSPEALHNPQGKLGVFQRGSKKLYRLRAGDFRIYFTVRTADQITCEVILPQHTLTDFVYRAKLPLAEDQIVEQHSTFWEYLDGLVNRSKKPESSDS